MFYTTTVCLVTDDNDCAPIAGVKVSLFDRDRFSDDDPLGTGITDKKGEVSFRYETEDFTDLEEQLSGNLPDLFVKVFDGADREVLSTRASASDNSARRHMQIRVPRHLLARGATGAPPA